MKEKATSGLGVVVNHAKFIAKEQENFLWEKGFLGSENGKILCFNLVQPFGIQFALRTEQENRNLGLENPLFCLEHDEAGYEFSQYTEDINKTNNGGRAFWASKGKLFVHKEI